ncbi:MAG: hypothetical protein ACJ0NC_03275 [Candidatus Marivariicella sp.]
MKKINILLIFVSVIFGCSEPKKSLSDKEVLIKLYENKINNKYSIDSIITYKAPTKFKKIPVEFDIYQVIYNKENKKKGSKFYTLTINEIFRIGKGLDCIIISKEIRRRKTGEIITDLKSWFTNNKEEKLLDWSMSQIPTYDYKFEKNNLPNTLQKVICD